MIYFGNLFKSVIITSYLHRILKTLHFGERIFPLRNGNKFGNK
jgi:hypothetical protein